MTKESIQTPAEYIAQLPADRQEIVKAIAETLSQHLPEGFQQVMSYGMIGFVVPHSIFPDGYKPIKRNLGLQNPRVKRLHRRVIGRLNAHRNPLAGINWRDNRINP